MFVNFQGNFLEKVINGNNREDLLVHLRGNSALDLRHTHNVIGEMVSTLLNKILHHTFFLKDGWKTIEEHETFAMYYSELGLLQGEQMLR